MLHHRTNNPTKRAAHIADRLEKEESVRAICAGKEFLWFEYWLDVYYTVLQEFNYRVL